MHTINRRQALHVGVLGGGMSLAQFLQLQAAGKVANQTTADSAILVFLKGGPSHQDMFDMKPRAPAEYRGEFRPIATAKPGIQICEHLPQLARSIEDYSIVRGVTHNLAAHGLGSRYLLTGNRPNPLLRYPTYGSVLCKEKPARGDVPGFVAVDNSIEGPGFLGVQHGALNTGEKPRNGYPIRVRGISLDEGLTLSRVKRRSKLLRDVDHAFNEFRDLEPTIKGLDELSQRARRILLSSRTREAFDLEKEKPAIRARFGRHEFGLSCLLACRLISAGVRFVTVVADNWDTHADNFRTMRTKLLPAIDQALAAVLETLSNQNRLSKTAVLVTGEFGRTPKVNGRAGRDHWPRAMFSLLAGGGLQGGQVIGGSDAKAAQPASDPISPDDVAATFYSNLGISPQTEYKTNTGRPVQIVRNGKVLRGL